ncbi:MAG: hypothetical protein HOY71_04055 [Nonomuraea sp.]|nr:hypothetical protein [Nonomuraea sp.]
MMRPLLGLIKGQLAKRLRKVGSRWLAERLADSDELALSRAQPRLADQILCEALLEDLSTAVSEHLLARNPAVLIDGAQTELGRELLNALVAAKAHRAAQERGDPLVVIAGASSWVELGGKWRRERVVQASEASLAGWRAHANGSRWYPVLLDQVKPDPSALYRLTGGHLAAVVEFSGHHGPALRAHLAATRRLDQLEPEHLPDDLVAWAAAPDVERAEEALLGSPQRAGAIRRELGTRLWLATRGDRTVIRAWPRRLLLNRLARDGARWDEAHAKLEGERGDLYHVLARVRPGDPEGLLDRVVTELDRAFEDPEKHRWILDLDRITAAPNRLPLDQPADRLRESLVKDLPIRTRVDVIRSLVVSKWFRGDPLLDPGRDLEIRELYHELANLAGSGSGDLRDEGYGYG